jgi:hypothetical protein
MEGEPDLLSPVSSLLTAFSAAVAVALGLIHAAFTFHGTRLHPSDDKVRVAMERSPLRLSRQTTTWNAWIGFNASHSLGLLLFGALYGYLSLAQNELLAQSAFLELTGFVTLSLYVFLSKRFWFNRPFQLTLLAWILYVAGRLAAHLK